MFVLDLLIDLHQAKGDKAKEETAYAAFERRKRMAQTPGEAATTLLHDCTGPDGKPLLLPNERVELIDGQLVTIPLN